MNPEPQNIIEYHKQLLRETPSIEFIDFEPRSPLQRHLSLNAGLAETELGRCGNDCADEIAWMMDVLRKVPIRGEMIFLFDNDIQPTRALPSPYSRVILGEDYAWVEPLWRLGEYFVFIPIDYSFYLQILWWEEYYGAFISYLKDLPPLESGDV